MRPHGLRPQRVCLTGPMRPCYRGRAHPRLPERIAWGR